MKTTLRRFAVAVGVTIVLCATALASIGCDSKDTALRATVEALSGSSATATNTATPPAKTTAVAQATPAATKTTAPATSVAQSTATATSGPKTTATATPSPKTTVAATATRKPTQVPPTATPIKRSAVLSPDEAIDTVAAFLDLLQQGKNTVARKYITDNYADYFTDGYWDEDFTEQWLFEIEIIDVEEDIDSYWVHTILTTESGPEGVIFQVITQNGTPLIDAEDYFDVTTEEYGYELSPDEAIDTVAAYLDLMQLGKNTVARQYITDHYASYFDEEYWAEDFTEPWIFDIEINDVEEDGDSYWVYTVLTTQSGREGVIFLVVMQNGTPLIDDEAFYDVAG